MVRPTMGRPCSWSRAATVELSTPPLMATATMPGEISWRSGSASNWVSAGIDGINSSKAFAPAKRRRIHHRAHRVRREDEKRRGDGGAILLNWGAGVLRPYMGRDYSAAWLWRCDIHECVAASLRYVGESSRSWATAAGTTCN